MYKVNIAIDRMFLSDFYRASTCYACRLLLF